MSGMDDFERRLRQQLQSAASTVEPDPAAWRQLNARIRRRRAVLRGGGLALAGAAAALVAVAVIPGNPRVELGPAEPDAVAAPSESESEAHSDAGDGLVSDAGGIVYSDGDSIHVADLSGEVLFTPAQGEGTSVVTDLAVLPGGTVADFTMAYRFDVTVESPEDCGDISWTRVVGPENNVAGGGLPGVSTLESGACLGAPVFASDGSALGWLAELPDGTVALQAVNWTPQGPVEGSQTTIPLDLGGLVDPQLVGWEHSPSAAEVAGSGHLLIRATDPEDGSGVHRLPVVFGSGVSVVVPDPAALQRVEAGQGDAPGKILDVAGDWTAVRLATQDAEELVGLAYRPTLPDQSLPAPLTAETGMLLEVSARPFLDAIDGTALAGIGAEMHLLVATPAGDGIAVRSDLPVATTAALLSPPIDPDAPAEAASPTASPGPTVTVTPQPSTPTAEPTIAPAEPTDADEQVPAAVTHTGAAIRTAAQARDWEALAALIPASGFTSNYGGQSDHIAYYQRAEAAGEVPLGTLVALLAEDPVPVPDSDLWVWPQAYLADDYFGWRVGVTAAGTWQFYVASD